MNNAAVTLFGRIEETPADRSWTPTFLGYLHGARAVIPIFREQGRGVLINVSSMVGNVGQPYTSMYVASKFAINGLSECLRMEDRYQVWWNREKTENAGMKAKELSPFEVV